MTGDLKLRKGFLPFVLVLSLALLIVRPSAASAQSGLVSAIGAYDSNPYGTQANIQTADPQIRDGGYSWMRSAVQYNPPGGPNYFAEIGWMKYSNGEIVVHVASMDPNLSSPFEQDYPYQPAINSTHNYEVFWNAQLSGYDLFYDGIWIDDRPAYYTLTRVFSGGEASSDQNAMGISGNLNNQYAPNSSGGWTLYPSHYDQVAPGYWVTDIDASDWQVGGTIDAGNPL